jgi:Arc/MetJ-type ribon-helix-helix transcriptional regulator
MVGRTKQDRPPVSIRVPAEQYDWADRHAQTSDRGLRSASDVFAHALRLYRESEEERMVRRELFQAWVDSGKKWPPPPGLVGPGIG